jgi:hypothetical protein
VHAASSASCGCALHFDNLDQAVIETTSASAGRRRFLSQAARQCGRILATGSQPTRAPVARARGRRPASADLTSDTGETSQRIRARGLLSPLVNCIFLSAIAARWRIFDGGMPGRDHNTQGLGMTTNKRVLPFRLAFRHFIIEPTVSVAPAYFDLLAAPRAGRRRGCLRALNPFNKTRRACRSRSRSHRGACRRDPH